MYIYIYILCIIPLIINHTTDVEMSITRLYTFSRFTTCFHRKAELVCEHSILGLINNLMEKHFSTLRINYVTYVSPDFKQQQFLNS